MILAAGFGKRIHPLTLKNPKPLLRIGNETLLSNTLKFLEIYKINQAQMKLMMTTLKMMERNLHTEQKQEQTPEPNST